MTMRFFNVVLGREGERRTVRVPSETQVQAADAAMPLARPGESVLGVHEVEDDGLQEADALPPLSQAAEWADETPGAAATREGRPPFT